MGQGTFGRLCSVEGCNRPHRRNGFCDSHDKRAKAGGLIDTPIRAYRDDLRRLECYSQPGELPADLPWLGRCIEWTGARTKDGYGKVGAVGGATVAHRWAYQVRVGPIPQDLTLDHLCLNLGCVNVWHLQPVPMAENSRRANARRTLPRKR